MIRSSNERTLIGCIYPKKVAHINGVRSFAVSNHQLLALFSGLCSSIVYDFYVKNTGKQNLRELPELLPVPTLDQKLQLSLIARTLRLNCVISYYAELWEELYSPQFSEEIWAKTDSRLSSWKNTNVVWSMNIPLRTQFERRQALVELDVLSAIALNLKLKDLIAIYRIQFARLIRKEECLLFDQRGFVVPVKTISGQFGVDESHPDFSSMVPPFTPVDREADYRQAWAHFEKRLQEQD